MYKLVYYIKKTEGLAFKEQEYNRYEQESVFRLRRDALRYIQEILKQDYIAQGYATEDRKGGIYLYKSESTEQGDREITEIIIKAEKVG